MPQENNSFTFIETEIEKNKSHELSEELKEFSIEYQKSIENSKKKIEPPCTPLFLTFSPEKK